MYMVIFRFFINFLVVQVGRVFLERDWLRDYDVNENFEKNLIKV